MMNYESIQLKSVRIMIKSLNSLFPNSLLVWDNRLFIKHMEYE
jgi:hypothetical protein